MSLSTTVLFDTPQSPLDRVLNSKFSTASCIKIVTGFATIEGVRVLERSLKSNPSVLNCLVVGAATFKAFESMDRLVEMGVPLQNLFIHLGHTRPTTSAKAAHSFYRYHPMLHSKVYYAEYSDGSACAIIGSHNVTGYALHGLNGEAAVMIEGDRSHLELQKVRNHIEHAQTEALNYDPTMKDAYAWWAKQFLEGMVQKANDLPKGHTNEKTVLIFCEAGRGMPRKNDILYFELPAALGKVQSMKAEVHVFIFDTLPSSPNECLASLPSAKISYWGTVEGIENRRGGRELDVNWYLDKMPRPVLQLALHPFRPSPGRDMQQIRVRLRNDVFDQIKYLFGKQTIGWTPIMDRSKVLQYDQEVAREIEKLKLVPAETREWYLVTGLSIDQKVRYKTDERYEKALQSMTPEAGSFILFSTGRAIVSDSEPIDEE